MVNDLLKLNVRTHARLPLCSHIIEDIKETMKRDKKQRFDLIQENYYLLIKANQGHSMEIVESDMPLEPLISYEHIPIFVHGTYLKNLGSIKKSIQGPLLEVVGMLTHLILKP